MSVTVVLAAGGSGSRMGTVEKKQYIELLGKPVLSYSLRLFLEMDNICRIVLVIPETDFEFVETAILSGIENRGKILMAAGGKSRQESVRNGILAAGEDTEILVVHDGARPFVTEGMVMECIKGAKLYGAATAAVPVKDTIKSSIDGLHVDNTPRRDCLFSVQTPQAFKYGLIRRAHEDAACSGLEATDDATLIELFGGRVVLSEGSYENIKLTSPEDMIFAEALARHKKESTS